ncbi:epidermal growth factor receptor substrate 15-like 1 isoform X2 [Phymastichus coffea]|uniref:epidermal growth factor receptor substrate 15-like 1 isoform X2 n=1 Tax=Phymastichus coffea TaxID=108790 RepID=UPI00273AA5BA|nr:epidermal growth factor receptor substrate 15-like 1 isoform X2 [Phymastichus coffea]
MKEVAGSHAVVYESLYSLVDPENCGQIRAIEAAKFLKKSNLSDIILSKIWDLSDPGSRGYLDKSGVFVALKLCALAQQGYSLSMSNIFMDVSPPNMGEDLDVIKSKAGKMISIRSESKTCWAINPLERAKYKQLFMSLEPINGYIPGNKVKGVLMDSKLPLETLGKIWDLADIDKDGKLNEHEFTVAMHLVYKALEKNTVPNILPMELQDISGYSSTNTDIMLKTVNAEFTNSSNDAVGSTKEEINKWVVSEDDQKAAEKLFIQADVDCDGFVSGLEIKDIFFQSGLSQSALAQIWSLCDIFQHGKLNKEQFFLAMWLIKQKLNKKEIPARLSSDMIPPSLRKITTSEHELENNNICNYSNTNPECEIIGQEISSIMREKQCIEKDLSQKDADIKIKIGEIKSLQSELDTLAATLRQLDNQKGEAQKRLNDLKIQIEKLHQQATDQESTLRIQEDEINSKRQELESLKSTEQSLDSQQLVYKNQLIILSKKLQATQLKSSQIKALITQLQEQQRQIIDAISQYDSAFSIGDSSVISESTLFLRINLEEYTHDINDDSKDDNDTINNNGNNYLHNDGTNDENRRAEIPDPFGTAFSPAVQSVYDPFGEDPFAALHAPVRSGSPSPALPPKKTKQPPPRPAPPRSSQGSHVSILGCLKSTSVKNESDPFTLEFADFDNFQSKI